MKSVLGVYVTCSPLTLTVPFDGPPTMVKVGLG